MRTLSTRRLEHLALEERLVQPTGLRRRQPWRPEDFYDLVGDLALVGRHARHIPAPAEARAYVLVEPWRPCQLVGDSVQVANLFEQRLELLVVNRHEDTRVGAWPF